MNPEEAAGWAEHLTNPYALAGFVLLVFSGFAVKNLPSARLKSAETYRMMRLLIVGGFALGALAIILAFTQPLFSPKTQVVRNIKSSETAIGGNQAAIITSGQAVNMQRKDSDCEHTSQTVESVEDSRVAIAGCEASTTARE